VAAAEEPVTARAFALLLAFAAVPAAADECYSVDTAGGNVRFEVKQAGAPFSGTFRRIGGTVCLALERVTRIEVWLEPASVETELPEIDAALKEKEFFDTRAHPRITFVSNSIEAGNDRQLARGTLEIKGKRREMSVPFRLGGAAGRPAVSGSIAINRLDYAIGTGEWADTRWLAADVKIDFSAPLSRR
jgi:polyisoprenoid-binding protein YceI